MTKTTKEIEQIREDLINNSRGEVELHLRTLYAFNYLSIEQVKAIKEILKDDSFFEKRKNDRKMRMLYK